MVGGIGNMEVAIENIKFKSTHEFEKYSISLSALNGHSGTTLIVFEPCIGESLGKKTKEILKELLEYIFKNPEEFITHWIETKNILDIKKWVNNANLWEMEFRLHSNGSSGPWVHWYMNDENKELKELSESFINYFI